MPGPGGGGRSGGGGRGFGGGGFGGGSHHGGGFGGGRPGGMHHGHHPHHPPHHHHHRHYGGWRYRPMYGGAGCLGGFLGMALGPIFAVIIVAVVLIGFIGASVSEIANGGSVAYDEAKLQAYADRQYTKAFDETAFEDNILIVFLTAEDHYDYVYIAWVGDHIDPEIAELFGDDYTELGRAMATNISDTDYSYSLDTDLARIIKRMAQKIEALNLESSYICREENRAAKGRLVNDTNLVMTEDTVNMALEQFTQITGIPCTVVVEEAEAVFGRSVSTFSWVSVILVGVVALIVVVNLVQKKKQKEEKQWN